MRIPEYPSDYGMAEAELSCSSLLTRMQSLFSRARTTSQGARSKDVDEFGRGPPVPKKDKDKRRQRTTSSPKDPKSVRSASPDPGIYSIFSLFVLTC